MNFFRLRTNGTVLSEQEYRSSHPAISFPQILIPEDADPILASPRPSCTNAQYVISTPPVQDALDNWVQGWQVLDYAAEVVSTAFEAKRAALIRQVDSLADSIIHDCIGNRATQYLRAEAQARAYTAAYNLDPEAPVPSMVLSWATTKGWTGIAAATNIIAQADAWLQATDAIYDKRLKAKEDMRVSTTDTQLDSANSIFLAFTVYIRGLLGK